MRKTSHISSQGRTRLVHDSIGSSHRLVEVHYLSSMHRHVLIMFDPEDLKRGRVENLKTYEPRYDTIGVRAFVRVLPQSRFLKEPLAAKGGSQGKKRRGSSKPHGD